MAITSKSERVHVVSNNGVEQHKLGNDNDKEAEVAAILLELPFLMTKDFSHYRFDYNWGFKKTRSAVKYPPSSPPLTRRKTPSPLPPEAASPDTPLSFSPSDSDYSKSNKIPRLSLRKEELEQAVKERLDTQHQLTESIEKVKVYMKSLIADNSRLKATKQELVMNKSEKKWEEGLKVRTTACTTEEQEEEEGTSRTVNDQVHAVASTSTASASASASYPLIQPHYQAQLYPFTSSQLYHQLPWFDLNKSPEEAERDMRKRETDQARQHRYRIRKDKLTRVRP